MDDETLIARWNAGDSYGALKEMSGQTEQTLANRIARLRQAGAALRFGPAERAKRARTPQLLCEDMTIFTLQPNECRYLVRENVYCCQPQHYKSYCKEHAELCYTSVRQYAIAVRPNRDTPGMSPDVG